MGAGGIMQLVRSAPYFPVADVARSVAHYERVLGFKREYVAGNQFAIVSRDGLPIMLGTAPTSCTAPSFKPITG
jgi:hypothetical protein